MNPRLYSHIPKPLSSIIPITIIIIAISLLSATTLLSLQYDLSANAQSASQSQKSKTKNTNATAATPPVGNVKQLSKALGNNTKMLTSGANIGNPTASKAASAQQKVTAGTPTTGLPSNPTKGSSKPSNPASGICPPSRSSVSSGPCKA
jgi:hypothetical protein